jgi:hypothetical protein
MAAGARYLRNHWDALTRFVTDGRLPLDNNTAERQQRLIAVGRKGWLFVASEDGGTWVATLLAVFQSCRLQRLDPLDYLTGIMPALIAGDVDPPRLTHAAFAHQQPAGAGWLPTGGIFLRTNFHPARRLSGFDERIPIIRIRPQC